MSGDKLYKVLILEDDPRYAEPLKTQIVRDSAFKLLGVTDSADEAYTLIKTGLPDAIIVDLGLSEGDGIELLHRLRSPNESLPIMPYVLVITSFTSELVMAELSEGLADFVFKKQNKSYSPEKIVKHLHIMSRQFHRNKQPVAKPIDNSLDVEKQIRMRIDSELEQYYMSEAAAAKKYLAECIYQVIILPEFDQVRIGEIYTVVGELYKKEARNVDMGVRRLLSTAFIRTHPDDLERLYAPYVDIGRGSPQNKDFIVHVANKIKKEIFS